MQRALLCLALAFSLLSLLLFNAAVSTKEGKKIIYDLNVKPNSTIMMLKTEIAHLVRLF